MQRVLSRAMDCKLGKIWRLPLIYVPAPTSYYFMLPILTLEKCVFFFILGRKLLKPSIDLCQFLSLSLSESFKPQYNNYNLYQVLPRCVWMICFHRCLFSFFSFEPATIILMFWQLFLFPVCVLFLFWD